MNNLIRSNMNSKERLIAILLVSIFIFLGIMVVIFGVYNYTEEWNNFIEKCKNLGGHIIEKNTIVLCK